MSREIFDLIDTATADWSISGDAMRSRPSQMGAPRRDGVGVDLTAGFDDTAFIQSIEQPAAAVAKAHRQYTEALERLDASLARAPSPLGSLLAELLRDS